MGIKSTVALTAVSIALASTPAAAATFIYDSTKGTDGIAANNAVGTHDALLATYDTDSDLFTWSSTFGRNTHNGLLADGAWLVLSDGENPKNNKSEYAIFYLDGKENKVSIYDYDGVNSSGSWKTQNYLGATALNVTDNGDQRTFDFSLDMTSINGLKNVFGSDWKGTSFGSKIGVWFHGVDGLTTQYLADGRLSEFKYTQQGWYDSTYGQDTEKVPEPTSVLAIGLFAAVAGVSKLRQSLV